MPTIVKCVNTKLFFTRILISTVLFAGAIGRVQLAFNHPSRVCVGRRARRSARHVFDARFSTCHIITLISLIAIDPQRQVKTFLRAATLDAEALHDMLFGVRGKADGDKLRTIANARINAPSNQIGNGALDSIEQRREVLEQATTSFRLLARQLNQALRSKLWSSIG